MLKQRSMVLLGAIVIAIIAFTSRSQAQQCVDVRGKIFNNIVSPVGDTLGIVQLTWDNDTKIKCGISGTRIDAADPTILNFIHTLVCEDHSQLSLQTTGKIDGQKNSCLTFTEHSVPFTQLPAIGLFEGITSGSISIVGTVCELFKVDMKFQGVACFP